MRVVHLIKAKQIGGAERHLLMLLPALIQREVDAHLLILVEPDNPMDDLFAEAEARGIPAEAIVVKGTVDALIVNRIRAKLNDLKPDILHTHLIHADTFGLAAAKLANVKYLITSRHNDDDFRSKRVVKWASGMMWSGFDACIAISDAIKQFAIEVEGAPPEKVYTVKYGIEHESLSQSYFESARADLLAELNLSDDVQLLGMACRLVEQKGVTYAIDALQRIHNQFPNAHLVIAGDGELMLELIHLVAQLELTDHVHFLGWRGDVPRLMAALDIFLMPSLWEGFGLVALEAMSKRRPVIATRVTALPEVVADGETGLLVPPQNSIALAEALQTLLADRSLRSHMGLVGEDRVEQLFSVARMADETVAVYRKFVPKKPSTTGTVKRKVSIG
ncbi:MAG: glycosyltransferase family 4 protein [Chloroflexota bacterium]